MLTPGSPAPVFNLPDQRGQRVDSASLQGQRYVLYFYPKDDTPGCTREACSFRDHLPAFQQGKVKVFGVSADTVQAHAKFTTKYSLNFPLLADTELSLIKAYGVWVEKSLYGRKYMGIARATFVVGADGLIEKVWDKVSPDQHAQEVDAWLRGGDAALPAPKAKASRKTEAAPAPAASSSQSSAPSAPSVTKPLASVAVSTSPKPAPAAKPETAPVAEPSAKPASPAKVLATDTTGKKPASKKAASKQPAARKNPAKKAASKKTAPKKVAKKITAKKTPAKKIAPKKTAAKKTAAPKNTQNKAASKKIASKSAAKKSAGQAARRTPAKPSRKPAAKRRRA